jgi:hypothetical protein
MADAWLYEVHMARGTVYALRDMTSGTMWTERSEHAARQLAYEKRLRIAHEQSISHEELQRLLGHEPVSRSPAPANDVPAKSQPEKAVEVVEADLPGKLPADPPRSSLPFPVRYHLEDEDEGVVAANAADVISFPAAKKAGGIFCSEGQITPKAGPAPGTTVPNENARDSDDLRHDVVAKPR